MTTLAVAEHRRISFRRPTHTRTQTWTLKPDVKKMCRPNPDFQAHHFSPPQRSRKNDGQSEIGGMAVKRRQGNPGLDEG